MKPIDKVKREILIKDHETIKNYNYFDLKLFQYFKDQSN